MGILDKYKTQLEEDKKNENVSFPEGSHLKEEQKEKEQEILDIFEEEDYNNDSDLKKERGVDYAKRNEKK